MNGDTIKNNLEQVKFEIQKFYTESVKSYIIPVIIGILLFIIFLYSCDYLYRDKYKTKWKIRTMSMTTGSGQDKVQRYWVWQRYKKKFLMNDLCKQNIQPFYRHARKKRKLIKSKIPFRKEVYGKNG